MKHYRAINAINRRIVELQNEIEVCNKIVDEPEMMADYNFAKNDIKNFEKEINELTETMQFLINQ